MCEHEKSKAFVKGEEVAKSVKRLKEAIRVLLKWLVGNSNKSWDQMTEAIWDMAKLHARFGGEEPEGRTEGAYDDEGVLFITAKADEDDKNDEGVTWQIRYKAGDLEYTEISKATLTHVYYSTYYAQNLKRIMWHANEEDVIEHVKCDRELSKMLENLVGLSWDGLDFLSKITSHNKWWES